MINRNISITINKTATQINIGDWSLIANLLENHAEIKNLIKIENTNIKVNIIGKPKIIGQDVQFKKNWQILI